jgi:hypothetical protein
MLLNLDPNQTYPSFPKLAVALRDNKTAVLVTLYTIANIVYYRVQIVTLTEV